MIGGILLQGYTRGGGVVPVPPTGDFIGDLTAWVKTNLGLVLYPNKVPQKVTLPAASYQRLRTERDATLGGKPTGVVEVDLRLAVVSTRLVEAAGKAAQLRAALNGMTQADIGGTRIFHSQLDDESEGYTAAVDGSDAGRYEVVLDFALSYRE